MEAFSLALLLAGIVEVSPAGYPLSAATTAALVAVVTLAGWLPARRAARVPPTTARRSA